MRTRLPLGRVKLLQMDDWTRGHLCSQRTTLLINQPNCRPLLPAPPQQAQQSSASLKIFFFFFIFDSISNPFSTSCCCQEKRPQVGGKILLLQQNARLLFWTQITAACHCTGRKHRVSREHSLTCPLLLWSPHENGRIRRQRKCQ